MIVQLRRGEMTDKPVAVVVAGGSGMGAAAARKLASEGYDENDYIRSYEEFRQLAGA